MQATAAVLYEVKKPVVVEDVEVMEPGPHEVAVRWAANGVCHSDLHVVTGDYPHPLPVILGHEAAGVVEKVGPGVETVKRGDHVCSSYIPSCGRCAYCIGGQPTMSVAVDPEITTQRGAYAVQNVLPFVAVLVAKNGIG